MKKYDIIGMISFSTFMLVMIVLFILKFMEG